MSSQCPTVELYIMFTMFSETKCKRTLPTAAMLCFFGICYLKLILIPNFSTQDHAQGHGEQVQLPDPGRQGG